MSSVLEDKEAIRDVLTAYCFHADSGDHTKRAALFAEDAVLTTTHNPAAYRGRDAIEAFFRSTFPKQGQPGRRHYTTNCIITVSGNEAHAESYFLVVRPTQAGGAQLGVSFAGRYTNELAKQYGGWLIRNRQLIRDLAD